MEKTRPTREQITDHLRYVKKDGLLYWRKAPGNRAKVGDLAGSVSPYGYIVVGLLGMKLFRGHIVWFLEKRQWPTLKLDHKDTDRLNDRIANLRDVPQKWNNQNLRSAQKNNQSGLLGAYWDQARHLWFSSIKVEGRTLALGRYPTAEAAHAAYLAAKRKFHEGSTL